MFGGGEPDISDLMHILALIATGASERLFASSAGGCCMPIAVCSKDSVSARSLYHTFWAPEDAAFPTRDPGLGPRLTKAGVGERVLPPAA